MLKLFTAVRPYIHQHATHPEHAFMYLTGAGDPWEAVTVSQGELDFDVDPLSSRPRDPVCPEPVVLIGLQDIAHLVRPDGDVFLIHNAHLFPLQTSTFV